MNNNKGLTIVENVVSIAILFIYFAMMATAILYCAKTILASGKLRDSIRASYSEIETKSTAISEGSMSFEIDGVPAEIGVYHRSSGSGTYRITAFE